MPGTLYLARIHEEVAGLRFPIFKVGISRHEDARKRFGDDEPVEILVSYRSPFAPFIRDLEKEVLHIFQDRMNLDANLSSWDVLELDAGHTECFVGHAEDAVIHLLDRMVEEGAKLYDVEKPIRYSYDAGDPVRSEYSSAPPELPESLRTGWGRSQRLAGVTLLVALLGFLAVMVAG